METQQGSGKRSRCRKLEPDMIVNFESRETETAGDAAHSHILGVALDLNSRSWTDIHGLW
jgi:hypothetical protein